MKKVYSIAILSLFFNYSMFGQAAWLDPNPANVNGAVKIMMDVSNADCECPTLLNLDAAGDSLYLWTWEPTENMTVNNGQWNGSNQELKMTSEGNNVWSYEIVPTTFYNVDASTVYDVGISFLVKKFDGSAVDGVEPKSADQHVDVLPLGCVDVLCAFPQAFQEDDYLTIVYNNNLETHSNMQDLDSNNCFMYPTAVAGGVSYSYLDASVADDGIVNYPELQMKYEGEGKFYTTILSDDFFRINSQNPVPDGVPIEKVKVQFRKASFNGTVTQNYELIYQCE